MKCRPPLKCKRPQTREGENIENNSQIDFWLKKENKKIREKQNKIPFKVAASCFYLVRVASAPISFRLKWFMCVCNQFYGHRLRSLAERPDYISMPPLDLRDAGSWIFDLQSCWMLDAARLKPALHLGGMWPAPLMQRVYHVPWQVGATPPSAILSSMSR